LGEKFISSHVPKRCETLTLKNNNKTASVYAVEIFHLTAFFVDRPSSLTDLRKVFIAVTPKLSTEQIEDRLDTILEDNNSLKKTINVLNEKIDLLTKSMMTLTDVVNSLKTININKPPFSFAAVATSNTKPLLIDLSKETTAVMLPPSTPNSLKRKNTSQETNSNNSKIKKVDNTLNAKKPLPKQQGIKNFDSKITGTGNTNLNENKWRKPKNDIRNEKAVTKKLQKSFIKSVGTGSFEGLGAVDRPHCIQIKRVDNECEPEKIQDFLKNTLHLKFKDFNVVHLEHLHFKAYKVTISYLDKKVVNEKEKWPQGWVVNSFYPQKKSIANSASNAFQFRGNISSTASNSSNSLVQN